MRPPARLARKELEMAIPFVYVRARGSYREIGRQVGEAARPQIEASIAFFAENFAAMSGGLPYAEAQRQAAAYLRYARAYTPGQLAELEGMAEGAGVPLSALLVPNCAEELTSSEPTVGEQPLPDGLPVPGEQPLPDGQLAPGCTAVAIVAAGRHVVGHNMDWYVVDAVNNVLFDLTGPDGTRLLAFAGAAYLPIVGLNSHGIGNLSNSVHSTDNRVGVPNVFVRRSTMEAATVEAARDNGLLPARARGTNQFFADTSGRLWDIESSATAGAFADHSAFGYMAHTNHYVAPEMAPFEGSDHEESRTRLRTAEAMLVEGLDRGDEPVELVARILRCHEPSIEASICGHPDQSKPLGEQGMTVGSIICDLDERRLYACAGTPCDNPYQVFEMD
jgi:isopenicillin-N N-acyltransferase-like protein